MRYDFCLLYQKHQGHYENIKQFDKIVSELGVRENLFFPNYEMAPWHVQLIRGETTYNFWPHKLKGHIEYTKHVVEGKKELRDFLFEITSEDEQEIEVVE